MKETKSLPYNEKETTIFWEVWFGILQNMQDVNTFFSKKVN